MEKPSGQSHEIAISPNMRLVMVDGKLFAAHSKFAELTELDAKQLERWVLRHLREQVGA